MAFHTDYHPEFIEFLKCLAFGQNEPKDWDAWFAEGKAKPRKGKKATPTGRPLQWPEHWQSWLALGLEDRLIDTVDWAGNEFHDVTDLRWAAQLEWHRK